MARSKKHPTRHQRRGQFNQQSGSFQPESANFRRLPRTVKSRPNWWQRLLGQSQGDSPLQRRRETPPRSRRPVSPLARRSDGGEARVERSRRAGEQKQLKILPRTPVPMRRPSETMDRRSRVQRERSVPSGVSRSVPDSISPPRQPLPPHSRYSSPKPNLSPRPSRSTNAKKNPHPIKLRQRKVSPLVYGTRLLILGIGLGVVVGTLLSIVNPASHGSSGSSQTTNPAPIRMTAVRANEQLLSSQEIMPLKTALMSLGNKSPQLVPGVYIADLDTGAYVDWQGEAVFASASTIKIPIAIAFFQDVEAGKIRLDEPLTLKREFMVSGSGNLQKQKPGKKFTALETVTKMITISDNTATNMMIDRLGGQELLNQRFQDWGLKATILRNKLPDVAGSNTTSPKELADLLARMNRGELLSDSGRDRLMEIMKRTQRNHLLPQGLGEGAKIAHKTGNIASLVADAGLIELPNGKRYIAAVMVKRPRNSLQAEKLIRQISRLAYQYFDPDPTTPKNSAGNSDKPANSKILPNNPFQPAEKLPSTMAGRQIKPEPND